MSDDENLTSELSSSYEEFKQKSIIKHLAARGSLTLDKLAALINNPEHGKAIATIKLQDLFDEREKASPAVPKKTSKAPPPKKSPAAKAPAAAAKKTAKKAAKAPAAKKATKAPAAKKAAKKAPAAKAAKKPGSPKADKADKGKPKPRLDYEAGCKEVLAALKAADGPVGRGDLEKSTGFPGVQVRAFLQKLATEGKILVTGNGGRSARYQPK